MNPWLRPFPLLRVAAVIGLIALTLVVTIESMKLTSLPFQFDFKGDLYDAARDITGGQNPYRPQLIQHEVNILKAGGVFPVIASPRYPPLLMIAMIPFTWLGFGVASALFFVLCFASVVVALWLLEVRDWRCFAIALVSVPTVFGSWIGNVSTMLLLGTAITWRCRWHLCRLPVMAAGVIVAKLFLWPVAIWLLVTRRYWQLAMAAGIALIGGLASWAVIGFAGLTGYPRLLINIAYIGELRGSSLVTALLGAGMSTVAARVIALSVASVLFAAAWWLWRTEDGDERAFGLVIVAALLSSPVVWIHSMVLLYVPVALMSRRLSLLWFIPGLATGWASLTVGLELTLALVLCAPLLQVVMRPPAALWRPARIQLHRLRVVSLQAIK